MQQLTLLSIPRTQEYSLYVLKLFIYCAETARLSYRLSATLYQNITSIVYIVDSMKISKNMIKINFLSKFFI